MVLVCAGLSGATRDADALHQILYAARRSGRQTRNDEGHRKVEQHTQGTDTLGGDVEQVLVGRPTTVLEIEDVAGRKDQAYDHTTDRSLQVGPLVEDSQQDGGEERSGRQTEGPGHHLRHKARWIDSKVSGYQNRHGNSYAGRNQLPTLRNIGPDDFLKQIV